MRLKQAKEELAKKNAEQYAKERVKRFAAQNAAEDTKMDTKECEESAAKYPYKHPKEYYQTCPPLPLIEYSTETPILVPDAEVIQYWTNHEIWAKDPVKGTIAHFPFHSRLGSSFASSG